MEPTQKPVTVVYRVALLSLVVMAAFTLLVLFGHRGHKAARAEAVSVSFRSRLHTMPNPQVIIGGALVVCPATGTIAPASGAWQILNPAGTVVDTNASGGRVGYSSLFYVECPSSTGGTFKVQALAGAAIGANYSARCQTFAGTSSGPFDVVAPAAPTAPGTLTMTIT